MYMYIPAMELKNANAACFAGRGLCVHFTSYCALLFWLLFLICSDVAVQAGRACKFRVCRLHLFIPVFPVTRVVCPAFGAKKATPLKQNRD